MVSLHIMFYNLSFFFLNKTNNIHFEKKCLKIIHLFNFFLLNVS